MGMFSSKVSSSGCTAEILSSYLDVDTSQIVQEFVGTASENKKYRQYSQTCTKIRDNGSLCMNYREFKEFIAVTDIDYVQPDWLIVRCNPPAFVIHVEDDTCINMEMIPSSFTVSWRCEYDTRGSIEFIDDNRCVICCNSEYTAIWHFLKPGDYIVSLKIEESDQSKLFQLIL